MAILHSKITKRFFWRTVRILLPLGMQIVLLAQIVSASDFYAVVDNFGRRPRSAHMEVAVDTMAVGGSRPYVVFNVFDMNGTQLTEFTLNTNSIGFVSTASSINLFDMWGGQPLLVRASTPAGNSLCAATLHINSQGAPVTVGLLPTLKAGTPFGMGTLIPVALGNFRSASLLIANTSGGDTSAEVFLGTRGAPATGIYTNPRIRPNGIWKVDLTQNEALSHVGVSAANAVVVQVVIDDGNSTQSFMAVPIA